MTRACGYSSDGYPRSVWIYIDSGDAVPIYPILSSPIQPSETLTGGGWSGRSRGTDKEIEDSFAKEWVGTQM